MPYRLTRNLEASLIDWITNILEEGGWAGIRVEKSFTQVYEGELPCICINAPDSTLRLLEIGSNIYLKNFTIDIRIFATNDGMRLDLADFLIEKLEATIIKYYQYTITSGEISEKIESGIINILRILDNRKETINIENLSKEDKYRHLISLECRVAKRLDC